MGWFDEQIEERKRADSEALEESFLRIAGAVMGKRLSAALNDQRRSAKDAIEELLKYYRVKAREVPRSVTDMNEILEFLLRPYGIMRRNVKLEKFWYRDATGPMLGTRTDDGSVVALIPDSFSGYSFFDVKSGTRLKVNRKTQELIDGEAIAFYKPFPLKKMGLRDLWRFLTENVGTADVAPFLLSAFAATLAGLLTPRLNALLFSNVLLSGSMGALLAVSAALICATVSALLFGAIRSISIERLTRKLSVLTEAASMMRILSLPAAFFKRYGSGELSDRVQYLTLFVQNAVGVGLSAGLVALFSLLYVTQIFVYAPALVTPALCVIGATVAVSAVSALIQTGVTRERMELASKERGMAYALISGVQKIKLSGAEKTRLRKMGASVRRGIRTAVQSAVLPESQRAAQYGCHFSRDFRHLLRGCEKRRVSGGLLRVQRRLRADGGRVHATFYNRAEYGADCPRAGYGAPDFRGRAGSRRGKTGRGASRGRN